MGGRPLPLLDAGGEVRFEDAQAFLEHYHRDLRHRKLRAFSQTAYAPDERLVLRLQVPDGPRIQIQGRVASFADGVVTMELDREPISERRLAQAAIALDPRSAPPAPGPAPAPAPAPRPPASRPEAPRAAARAWAPLAAFEGRLTSAFDFVELGPALVDRPEPCSPSQAHTLLELLRGLARRQATATVRLQAEQKTKLLYLTEGDLALIRSDPPVEEEKLGRLVARLGRLGEESIRQAADLAARTRVRIGEALIQRGILERQQLDALLRLQIQYRLLDLMRWPDARFVVTPGPDPVLEPEAHRLPMRDVLLRHAQAFVQAQSAGPILLHFGNRMRERFVIRPGVQDLDRLLSRRQIEALEVALNGRRTLEEAVSACALGHIESLRSVLLLHAAGALSKV